MLGDQTESFASTQRASDQQGVTDVILGHWAQALTSPSAQSVLTLYRALPYTGGRSKLLADNSLEIFKKDIAAQTPGILNILGIPDTQVRESRLARFGHPLVVAAPNLLADGIAEAASRPIDQKIFFCNQDNWALPCIEAALGAAITAVHQMGELPVAV